MNCYDQAWTDYCSFGTCSNIFFTECIGSFICSNVDHDNLTLSYLTFIFYKLRLRNLRVLCMIFSYYLIFVTCKYYSVRSFDCYLISKALFNLQENTMWLLQNFLNAVIEVLVMKNTSLYRVCNTDCYNQLECTTFKYHFCIYLPSLLPI